MSYSVLKLLLATAVFVVPLFFQNCGPAFEVLSPIESASIDQHLQSSALALLSTNCKACHSDQNLGNVRNILDVNHLIESNLIVPGNPNSSRLFESISSNRMPPSGPLNESDKRTIRNWILQLGGIPISPTEDLDLTFTYKTNLDPLPYRTRLGKLATLMGSESHSSLNKVKNDRLLLGDYDYSRSVIPKFSWEATDMKSWLEAMEPICSSSDLQSRFAWSNGLNIFTQATLGRDLRPSDSAVIAEINSQSVTSNEKFTIFCLTTLTSMEFISK